MRSTGEGGAVKTIAYNPEALLHKPTKSVMRERLGHGGWDDEDDAPVETLTREQASALRAKNPSVSPWRVVRAQIVLGAVVATLAGLVTARQEVAWSALYGAAIAVVPGALMARGATRRYSLGSPGNSPGLGAVSLLSWSFVKIGVSVVMLLLAPRLIQPLSWPALLVALVLCVQVYWLALLWRGRG
jgi:ATP synthase protein I